MKKGLVFILFFYIGLVCFMPKSSLWNAFLQQIDHRGWHVETRQQAEYLLHLSLNKNKILQKKEKIADIEKIEILPLLFFNRIDAENIVWKRIHFDRLHCQTLFYKPWICTFSAEGSSGRIRGQVDMFKHTVTALLSDEKKVVRRLRNYGKVVRVQKGYRFVANYE